MTDALEARQEAHSIWDAAGDRYRSGETPPLPIPPALVRPWPRSGLGTCMARGTEAWRHGLGRTGDDAVAHFAAVLPGWRTGQPTHRPPFCRLRRLPT